ncbi:DoxX family protein [Marinomonas sp.]|uniref:DoxX family protein n=1 Tax=Marinomonas sp. TaxID=1904862 RepID=UPI003F9A3239
MSLQLLKKLVTTNNSLSAFILRAPIGIILMAHGSQKLFGWFGGYGLEGTGQWMSSIGLDPGYLMALLSGSAEFFGGLALLIGLLTRPAAFVVAFTMLIAIFSVHISHGLFASNGGYEYALSLFVVAIAILIQGAGRFSVDKMIESKLFSNSER